MTKADLHKRIAKLSPARRELLERRLSIPAPGEPDRAAIPPREHKGPCPLSFAQKRLWFLTQLIPSGHVYNVSRAFRLRGDLNRPALQQALDAIIARHGSLRTRFVASDPEPLQIVDPTRPLDLAVFDISSLPPSSKEKELQRLLQEGARQPFDLTQDLLLRVSLIGRHPNDHFLLLVTHHIASDGWTLEIVFSELSRLYTAFCTGEPASLAPLPVGYTDFVLWQREQFNAQAQKSQLAYWRNQLAGVPTVIDLPTDRPHPATQTFRGAGHTWRLPAGMHTSLEALGRTSGCTLFMTLLAVFQILLYRHSGQERFLVGTPVAGRNRVELEPLVGVFINTLVLQADLADNPTFKDLLERVRRISLGALANQDLPFEKLVEELGPPRSMSRNPLFQVMFNFSGSNRQGLQLSGLQISEHWFDTRSARFDLSLEIVARKTGLQCNFEYNTDLFDPATVERMAVHFQNLLAAVLKKPHLRVAELPLLSPGERQQLLVTWNRTAADYPRDTCVHELFEDQVRHCPGAVAVVEGNLQVDYGQLNRQANRLAHHLISHGVGHGTPVAVYLERSIDMIAALLAVLKTGGIYFPLAVGDPPQRLRRMLVDSQAVMMITHRNMLPEEVLKSSSGSLVTVVDLDADRDTIARAPDVNPPSPATAGSLAYVIYTSGSTGTPKGVATQHRAISCLVVNTDYIRLQATDVVAQASNATFDVATFEIWGALLHGCRLVIVPRQVLLSPGDFESMIRRQSISVLFLTTALFNEIAVAAPTALASIRCLLFAGEIASPPRVRAVLATAPPSELLHVYGPTESTTFATWYRVRRVGPKALSIPIGRPMANTRVYVLDDHSNPVPVGVVGELCIAGDGLALGYWQRPDLTAEKFTADPFDARSGARIYHTGDRVRYRPDGAIEFVGRKDTQIKLRGFRIEPGEIEAILEQHPAVNQCAVMLTTDESQNKRLVAYVVSTLSAPGSSRELRTFLKKRLPDVMIPSSFLMMAALPLTANGKIDRAALPRPHSLRKPRPVARPPGMDLESRLAAIWQDVLNTGPVASSDNFFELGGHSLLAVRLFARIEKAFKKKLPLATLLQAPTLAELARAIQEQSSGADASCLVAIQPLGSRPPFYCVHSVGGEVLGFYPWARYLAPDQPVMGIRARGADGSETPPATVAAMASAYVEEILAFQPRGPYYLGGYSSGGKIAFEMACQLLAAGEQVAFLALLDTGAPRSMEVVRPGRQLHLANRVQNAVNWTCQFARLGGRFRRTVLHNCINGFHRRRKRFRMPSSHKQTQFEIPDTGAPPTVLERRRQFIRIHKQAIGKFRPQRYPGRITLFRIPMCPLTYNGDTQKGWGPLAAGGVEVLVVPGLHAHEFAFYGEHFVEGFTAHLKEHLRKARHAA